MMKPMTNLTSYAFFSILLFSCTGMKHQMKRTPSQDLANLMETVDISNEAVADHELVKASADDVVIKKEVGIADIDQELPESEPDAIPYSRNFLKNKKTKRMQFWVDYFTKTQRERFQRFINNGEEYRHHIEEVFVEYGLPKELYYVGLIESGYYLGAKSHASAVGPWQFIKGTGTRYGLKITPELDERQDLFKASRAAAMYFKDLHNIFSSWELALSAYNAGENGIIRRIMKHGTRDFYELSRNKQLPTETINYVPKVLAAMHVIQNAQEYGFHIPQKKNRLFDNTELKPIPKNTSLAAVAKRLNVSTDLLKKLNPELKKNFTPRRFAGTYYLRVPQNEYSSRLAGAPQIVPTPISTVRPETIKELKRRTASVKINNPVEVKPSIHHVKRGETLISIARKYKTTPRNLALANNFSSWRTRVQIGQKLKLEYEPTVAKAKVIKKPITYVVRAGDNLSEIARVFDQNVSKIKRANRLKRGTIFVGQKIILPNTKKGIYTVKRGDHLTKVAKEFNQPLEAIIKLNTLKRKTIYPGQKLIVNMD